MSSPGGTPWEDEPRILSGNPTTYGQIRRDAEQTLSRPPEEWAAAVHHQPALVVTATMGLTYLVRALVDEIEERDTHIDRLKGELASAIGEN